MCDVLAYISSVFIVNDFLGVLNSPNIFMIYEGYHFLQTLFNTNNYKLAHTLIYETWKQGKYSIEIKLDSQGTEY